MTKASIKFGAATSIALILGAAASEASAQRRGGGGMSRPSTSNNRAVRSSASGNINSANRTNVNSGNRTNVNTGNVHINNGNVNINRDVHVDVNNGWGYWGGSYYRPGYTAAVATAAAVTTAAVVGSYYRTLPPSCATVYRGTVIYYQCGTTWYQPIYAGSSVQYVVVKTP